MGVECLYITWVCWYIPCFSSLRISPVGRSAVVLDIVAALAVTLVRRGLPRLLCVLGSTDGVIWPLTNPGIVASGRNKM